MFQHFYVGVLFTVNEVLVLDLIYLTVIKETILHTVLIKIRNKTAFSIYEIT